MYTEGQVLRDICAMKTGGISLRDIAKRYGSPIKHADIQRILHGQFPKGRAKRGALKVVELAPAPVCPVHGVVHTSSCPRTGKRPRWVRTFNAGHAGGRWE